METIAYTTRDKTGWGDGPWQDEPDKVQFADPATGLPCLAVRNPLGAWCGYVGVAEDHPWFGVDYSDVDAAAHGGLTFSSMCDPSEKEDTAICHIPGPGEPDHVWWLGFDCAHGSDYIPQLNAEMAGLNHVFDWGKFYPDYGYRTLEYVKDQCAGLAEQIAQAHPGR